MYKVDGFFFRDKYGRERKKIDFHYAAMLLCVCLMLLFQHKCCMYFLHFPFPKCTGKYIFNHLCVYNNDATLPSLCLVMLRKEVNLYEFWLMENGVELHMHIIIALINYCVMGCHFAKLILNLRNCWILMDGNVID